MAKEDFYNKSMVRFRESLAKKISSGESFNEHFFSIIGKNLKDNQKILDIGTGNGYVLTELLGRFSKYSPVLFGVDNSQSMIDEAIKNIGNKAHLCLGDNFNLPFGDNSFDVITAKNVTALFFPEIKRVLKNRGLIIFREYGSGKGLIEVSNLFPSERIIRARTIDYYTSQLEENGFTIELSEEHKIKRTYTSSEIIQIVKSFPFIDKFSKEDEEKILSNFNEPINEITSDPLIVVARKERNGA